MGNLQSTPSSSTTTIVQKKYDVFLNFRGEDTRNCFTCHLYEALHKKIETFIDNGLEKGDGIWPTLKGAIEQSKISVVIFSKDYASSKWCLRELVEIMEHKKMHNQIVIPVFYHVDPSDVRKQTGSFKDSFDKHGKESQEVLFLLFFCCGLLLFFALFSRAGLWSCLLVFCLALCGCLSLYNNKVPQEEVQKWREALTEASNLSGWDSTVTRPDNTLVDQIVKDIMKKSMSECTSHDYGALIGHKRIEEVLSLLCLHVPNVQIIGIWGMGGIGKTTIADAIFNKKSNQFQGVCFIQNVRERLQNSGGLVSLRKEILSQVLKDEHLEVDSPSIPSIIKERLNRTKVLIVLDDVDGYLQLENLVRGVDRLGLGSRIIITSRDKQVLQLCGMNDQNIYEVEGFNYRDALQLFCNYAFHENYPPEDLTVLSIKLVNYSKGNPLALKVLGSSLYQASKQEWESVVNTLRTKNLNRRIFNVLKISYDGLENGEKNTFLDIVCFFKGEERGYVEKIIGDCTMELGALIKKSLITNFNGYINMHDLLEEMGREIVDKESPNEPGKRSRLWRQEEVQNTLKYDEGTNAVQGIVLNLSNINDMQLSPQAFKKMYNLRFLKFNVPWCFDRPYNSKVHFPNGLSNLSDKLSSLIWHGFPLTALPSNFNPQNLVELDLRESILERLWEGTMHVPNLKLLILRGCKHLTNIPDLSDASLLEEIDLNRCQSLLDFPPLAPHLKYLRFLDLEGCKSLRSFQSVIHFESITSLALRDCANITKFPEISGDLESLDLRGSAIDEVPPSIGSLTKLSNLNLSRCKRLKHISTNICKLKSLQKLTLENCSALESFPEISENLKELNLSGTAIDRVPSSIVSLTQIEVLSLSECTKLKHISTNICKLKSLQKLNLANCSALESFPEISGDLRFLDLLGSAIDEVPPSIGSLTNLSILDLSQCMRLKHISTNICKLKSLHELNLANCSALESFPEISGDLRFLDLRGSAIDEVPPSIGSLTNLSNLDLSQCKRLKHISTNICKLKSLQKLNLANCSALESFPEISSDLESLDLRGSAIDEVPPSIGGLTKLSNLDLSQCKRLKHISTNICKLKSLHELNLANCSALESFPEISGDLRFLDLRGSAIDEVPPSIGSLTNLSNLDLSQCKRLKHISTNICKLKSLQKLNLANCSALESFPEISSDLECLDLRGSAIDEVPPSIGSLAKLSILNLSQCTRLKHISTNICKLKSLHQLNLANCSALESFPEISGDLRDLDLSGTAIDEVPPSIGSLTHIEVLSLSECTKLKHISTNICKLKSLQKLNLANCSALESFPEISGDLRFLDLSGTAIDEVPPSIGGLTKLSNLDLSQCKRLKHISTNICKLKSLHELNLANCSALESFPEISGDLRFLDLRGSAIDEVPPSIGSLTKLFDLNLSNCTRLKHISTNICKLKSLHWLNLENCSALESFPEISGDLRGLDLSGTAIDEVPPSIGGLTKISNLDLSQCKRLKHISTNICKLKSLQKLNLANCSALESFPEISSDLESLDLRGSAIDEVPPSIGGLTKLSNLDLSQCKRLKHISTNICKLKSLHELNLANCSALESFPKISGDLRFLDLRGSAIDEVPPSIGSLAKLSILNLSQCTRLKHISTNICKLKSLHQLNLANCSALESFPEISGDLRDLDLSGTAIDEVPPSIGSLTQIEVLSLSECTKLKHISTNICKLKSLQLLYLKNCSELEIFPEIWETMECLQFLDLSGTAIKELPHRIENLNGLRGLWLERCKNLEELPSSICHLTSLCFLYLSDCSKLEILPDNFGNLKSLAALSIDRTAISQLPSTLKVLYMLSCCGCRGLRFTHSSYFPCSLRGSLRLNDCNLKEIPEDICHLSSLVFLDLSGNDFETLPKSMKQLSKLTRLLVNNCSMLQSLTELPLSIGLLSASDCKQLRSIPDASELVNTGFIFTNCPNLEETAVGNILKTVEGYEGKLDLFSFICPGSEVPERFSYKSKSNESSIKFQMARHNCFNGLLPEFIVCAVIEFEEYPFDANDVKKLVVECSWAISDGDESDPLTGSCGCALIDKSDPLIKSDHVALIKSDHVALWHCKAFGCRVLKSEFTNCSFEFLLEEEIPNCRVKSCGVWPVTKISNEDDKVEYAEPIKKFGVTIEDIGETRRKRSRK